MHELAITEQLVASAATHAQGRPVARVKLQIGQLSGVLADAVRFCFDACTSGTALEGASLEIEEPPGQLKCLDCGAVFRAPTLYESCACGSFRTTVEAGTELFLQEIELR